VAECLFCAIVAGEIPATTVLETDRIRAFRDINPQAPTHVLVIPKTHYADVAALADADAALLASPSPPDDRPRAGPDSPRTPVIPDNMVLNTLGGRSSGSSRASN
jgi:hypothetical protein